MTLRYATQNIAYQIERALRDDLGREPTLSEVLAAANNAREAIADWERSIVKRLRSDGASWQAIGDMLGITRQAAQQRFRDPDDAPIPVAVRANYMTWWWDNERPALIESGDIEELDGQLRGRTPEGRELLRTMGFDLD